MGVCAATGLTWHASSAALAAPLSDAVPTNQPASPHLDAHLGCCDPLPLDNLVTLSISPDSSGELVSPNFFLYPRLSPHLIDPPPRLLSI